MLQYTTNFVIYAARSEQYRKAYIHYIKTTLPWLFEFSSPIWRRKQQPSIFIINPVLRRTNSSPELTLCNKGKRSDKSGSIKVDMKLEYSLDIKFENVLSSCNFAVTDIEPGLESQTIIILPADLQLGHNKKKQRKKKTRFFELEEDELSSEVRKCHEI